MPPDRPLTEADIQLVERWILNGAFRDPAIVRARQDGGVVDAAADAMAPATDSAADAPAAQDAQTPVDSTSPDAVGGQ